MWLRRLVGVIMIVTCVAMSALVVIGFFSPVKVSKVGLVDTTPTAVPPTVTITAKPDAISAGSFSALSWTTTGNPDSCIASGAWAGTKTAYGAESTGRVSTPGTYKYTLACTNKAATVSASVTLAVGAATAPPPSSPAGNSNGSASGGTAVTYCGGASPCYSPREVGQHNSSGNCWGYNGDRVINVSGLDAGYHMGRTGLNIQISSVCGKDLAPALSGQVSASDGSTRNHNPTTKANSDVNEIPYLVGYIDKSKP